MTQPPSWTAARDAAAEKWNSYWYDDSIKNKGAGTSAYRGFQAGWNAGRTFELERAKDLANALEGLMKLIDDGVLVRNTDDDHDIMKFMEQGVRLTTHLQACQTALAAYGGQREHE